MCIRDRAEDDPGRVRYLLDPSVAEGSAWATGATTPGVHVVNLVHGRDFSADGIIQAAEVRDGDPSPDGAGELRTARGIEMGHIFQLGRKYADALGLKVLDEHGKLVTVTMGSYGIGAVSYTHLDVYKRQIVQRKAAGLHEPQGRRRRDRLGHRLDPDDGRVISRWACLLYTSRCV